MVRAVESNLEMIRHVAKRLGDLRDRVVFLGGAATALLITDKAKQGFSGCAAGASITGLCE